MKGEWRDYLVDILESALEVEIFIAGMSYDNFFRDKKTINAVIRSLEVMGEAAKRVPEDIRAKYPEIPWKRMAGMRDKLIHEYAGVDLETVWDVAKEELPAIKPMLERLKESLD
jgi:uncharacterized protein with HEPN domain